VRLVGDIVLDEADGSTKTMCEALAIVGKDVREDDRGTLTAEHLADGCAEPASRTGYESDFSVELTHGFC
jgi:hypothetical protein